MPEDRVLPSTLLIGVVSACWGLIFSRLPWIRPLGDQRPLCGEAVSRRLQEPGAGQR